MGSGKSEIFLQLQEITFSMSKQYMQVQCGPWLSHISPLDALVITFLSSLILVAFYGSQHKVATDFCKGITKWIRNYIFLLCSLSCCWTSFISAQSNLLNFFVNKLPHNSSQNCSEIISGRAIVFTRYQNALFLYVFLLFIFFLKDWARWVKRRLCSVQRNRM